MCTKALFRSLTSRAASARNSTLSASFFTKPGHTMGSSGSRVSPKPRHRSARARSAFFATWRVGSRHAHAVSLNSCSGTLVATLRHGVYLDVSRSQNKARPSAPDKSVTSLDAITTSTTKTTAPAIASPVAADNDLPAIGDSRIARARP